MDSFDGRVDVIIVEAIKPIPKSGEKGRVCKMPTLVPEKRKGAFWKIKNSVLKRVIFAPKL